LRLALPRLALRRLTLLLPESAPGMSPALPGRPETVGTEESNTAGRGNPCGAPTRTCKPNAQRRLESLRGYRVRRRYRAALARLVGDVARAESGRARQNGPFSPANAVLALTRSPEKVRSRETSASANKGKFEWSLLRGGQIPKHLRAQGGFSAEADGAPNACRFPGVPTH